LKKLTDGEGGAVSVAERVLRGSTHSLRNARATVTAQQEELSKLKAQLTELEQVSRDDCDDVVVERERDRGREREKSVH